MRRLSFIVDIFEREIFKYKGCNMIQLILKSSKKREEKFRSSPGLEVIVTNQLGAQLFLLSHAMNFLSDTNDTDYDDLSQYL